MRALQFTLAFLLILGPVFFRFPARDESFSPSISILYYQPFDGDATPLPDSWIKSGTRPFNAVWVPKGDASRIVMPARRIDIPAEKMAFAPVHGDGYFVFQRVGSEISFMSAQGELLWKKPFPAYPVTTPTGSPVFLMTGDANRVDVLDASGNLKGVKHIAGNFLTDYRFSPSGETCFVFGSGQLIVIDAKGDIAFRYDSPDGAFFKSCALSPDGQTAAVHSLKGESDVIEVLRRKEQTMRLEDSMPLGTEYTRSIALAVSNEGSVFAGAPDSLYFFRKGSLVWKREEGSAPAYALSEPDFLAVAARGFVKIADSRGRILSAVPSPFESGVPFQILPGPQRNQILIQSEIGLAVLALSAQPR